MADCKVCAVCEGSGEYPIHAAGKHVYNITCPDCGGDGDNQSGADAPAPSREICDSVHE